jgi:hypothetical protein
MHLGAASTGRVLTALALLLGAGVLPLRGQTAAAPAAESRVRVTALDLDSGKQQKLIGTVISTDPDGLLIRPDRSAKEVAFSWETIRLLDESTGRISRGETVILGIVVGGAIGAGTGYLLGEDCSKPATGPFDPCFSSEVIAFVFGVAGAATGAVGGLIVPRADRWRPRAIPYRLGVAARSIGRPALHLSLSF